MISGKKIILLCCLALGAIISCNDKTDPKEDDIAPGENMGRALLFSHSPSDTILLNVNCYYAKPEINMDCLDLEVIPVAFEWLEDSAPKQYYSPADKEIESMLSAFIRKTTGDEFEGDYPLWTEYRTEACTDIKIEMYNNDDLLISDITDKARFHYIYSCYAGEEDSANILITEDRKRILKIPIGTTIQEYLSFNPLLFAHAHFVFPEIDKNVLETGCHFKVYIQLKDGRLLEASTEK